MFLSAFATDELRSQGGQELKLVTKTLRNRHSVPQLGDDGDGGC